MINNQMKKLLLSLSLIPTISFSAVVEYDLRKGVDLTLTNSVTQSLLNQLVDAGTISATNKGGIIRRSGGAGSWWPNVTDNPRYTNFVWLDMINSPPLLKVYVCCGDVNSNWVVGSISAQSVGTAQIADYSITAVKMATNSVPSYAYIAGSIAGNAIADGGVIAGKLAASSVSNANYAPSSITGDKIALTTISNLNIYPNTITSNEIANGTINNTQIGNFSVIASNKLALQSINGTNIVDGGIAGIQIANNTITSNDIASASINRDNLSTNITPVIARAWAIVQSDATILKSHNITSASRRDQGDFVVFFGGGYTPSSTNYIVVANGFSEPSANGQRNITIYSNTTASCALNIRDGGGADQNSTFSIVFYDFP